MKKLAIFFTVLGLLVYAAGAQAGTFHFTGTLNYHNDVVQFNFNLANDATDVRVWTDSFQSGANFDPITALWTGAGTLIAENDDNDTVNPATQTYYDSGFALASLAAGNYIFTVTPFDNFARGATLAEGFNRDGETPIPIIEWWVNAPGYWSVWFDGVDQANVAPLPGSALLFGSALLALGVMRRKLGR